MVEYIVDDRVTIEFLCDLMESMPAEEFDALTDEEILELAKKKLSIA